jgi:RimJ/RimL family protein N-acetyltransferase
MIISFVPIDEQAASEIVRWCYEPPYEIYNLEDSKESIQYALDPQYNYTVMRDESGRLVGFCSFGVDGQVPGGDYRAEALDIGMGICPDFTGKGLGSSFVRAVLDFAEKEFHPKTYRVTIAAFNRRARRVWEKNGFQQVQSFIHADSRREFCVYTRIPNSKADPNGSNH